MKEAMSFVLIGLLVIVLFAIVLALPTMWLWNSLMPEIFGLTTIDFWQALELLLLSGLLFKSSNKSSSDER